MNQLKAGAILNYTVIILNLLVALLYTPYMLRVMGQNEFGLYSLVASIIAYLTVLDLGIGNAIVRYTAKFRSEGKFQEQYEMFGMFLFLYTILGLLSTVIGIGVYYGADSIFMDSMTFEEIDKAEIMILILVLNLAFTFPMSIFGSIITAYERFVFPRVVNILRIILNTIVMIVLLRMGYRAITMVVVQTIFNVLSLLINYYYCKRFLGIKVYFKKFNLSLLKEVGIYSFWILLDVIMNQLYWNTGQFVLGSLIGTAAVAVFAIAIQLERMYMQFSTAIASVFLPKVTSMVTRNDNIKQISNLFIRTGRVQNIVMSTGLFFFIIFGRQFIILWAGPSYIDAYYMTLFFFLALYVPLIQNLGITILQARNQMKFRGVLFIVISIISLFFQVILAKIWGGIGCSIAISAALIIGQGVIMNIYYNKKQHIDIILFWKEIMNMNLAPILVSGLYLLLLRQVSLNITWESLFLSSLIFIVIYVPIYFKFSLNDYERNLLLEPLKKQLKNDSN
ncbi:lipopolysaccharide biosynthesis protein [Bacteroides pyogenes]|uniref:lipopolysaccharide biosynthesis protein n=1 Tax=Bacteroides pyogenes TaxID=310300 RepID=UPI0011E475C6|nr:oligosaccharide flippase family protein [Bacteroides pyogenes]TYK38358.1 oligosaccharide flippase family protein [Bacteroides pyogenes]